MHLKDKLWFWIRPYGTQLAWWLAHQGQSLLKFFALPKAVPVKPPPFNPVQMWHSWSPSTDLRLIADGQVIGTAQEIRFNVQDTIRGTITTLILDRLIWKKGKRIEKLAFMMANEYGKKATLLTLHDVRITGFASNISTDDIVLEVRYRFTADRVTYTEPNTIPYEYLVDQAQQGKGPTPPPYTRTPDQVRHE